MQRRGRNWGPEELQLQVAKKMKRRGSNWGHLPEELQLEVAKKMHLQSLPKLLAADCRLERVFFEKNLLAQSSEAEQWYLGISRDRLMLYNMVLREWLYIDMSIDWVVTMSSTDAGLALFVEEDLVVCNPLFFNRFVELPPWPLAKAVNWTIRFVGIQDGQTPGSFRVLVLTILGASSGHQIEEGRPLVAMVPHLDPEPHCYLFDSTSGSWLPPVEVPLHPWELVVLSHEHIAILAWQDNTLYLTCYNLKESVYILKSWDMDSGCIRNVSVFSLDHLSLIQDPVPSFSSFLNWFYVLTVPLPVVCCGKLLLVEMCNPAVVHLREPGRVVDNFRYLVDIRVRALNPRTSEWEILTTVPDSLLCDTQYGTQVHCKQHLCFVVSTLGTRLLVSQPDLNLFLIYDMQNEVWSKVSGCPRTCHRLIPIKLSSLGV